MSEVRLQSGGTASRLAALPILGLLDVLHEYDCAGLRRAPWFRAALRRLAADPCEKCGLVADLLGALRRYGKLISAMTGDPAKDKLAEEEELLSSVLGRRKADELPQEGKHSLAKLDPLRRYLLEISQFQPLSAEEEYEL
ncbi:MAG TPA: sigma-70 factor domain-containing protein, partial [Acidobacteriota bacterium]|nr:sigma-70 factor domain-containing protein [Acidobacteriota bacterium]